MNNIFDAIIHFQFVSDAINSDRIYFLYWKKLRRVLIKIKDQIWVNDFDICEQSYKV